MSNNFLSIGDFEQIVNLFKKALVDNGGGIYLEDSVPKTLGT